MTDKRLLQSALRILVKAVIENLESCLDSKKYQISDNINTAKPTVLFFAPEAGIKRHHKSVITVAEVVRKLGEQALIVECDGDYPFCIVKDGYGFKADDRDQLSSLTCWYCKAASRNSYKIFKGPRIKIPELGIEKKFEILEEYFIKNPKMLMSFKHDGIDFGRLCFMDLVLKTKQHDVNNISDSEFKLLVKYMIGALVSYETVRFICNKVNVVNLVYFNEYSMLLSAALAAGKLGVRTTRITHAVHNDIDRNKLVVMPELLAINYYYKCFKHWDDWRNLSLTEAIVSEIANSQLNRLSSTGITIYSPNYKSTKRCQYTELGLDPSKKTLIAFTASLDEFKANQLLLHAVGSSTPDIKEPFDDQIHWLARLSDFVLKDDSLQLIVRIHPREGSTKRDGVSSSHLQLLRQSISESNRVKVIWPESDVSSYNLLEIADVALTSWTNLTIEAARLGVPTIIGFPSINPVPFPDVCAFSGDQDDYFNLIYETLGGKHSLEHILYAFRWTYLSRLTSHIDITDADKSINFKSDRLFREIRAAVIDGKNLYNIDRSKLLEYQGSKFSEIERVALIKAIKIYFLKFLTGNEIRTDHKFIFASDFQESLSSKDVFVKLLEDSNLIEVTYQGGFYARRSPLLVRLALLLKDERYLI